MSVLGILVSRTMCFPIEMVEPGVAGPPHVARKRGILLKKNLGPEDSWQYQNWQILSCLAQRRAKAAAVRGVIWCLSFFYHLIREFFVRFHAGILPWHLMHLERPCIGSPFVTNYFGTISKLLATFGNMQNNPETQMKCKQFRPTKFLHVNPLTADDWVCWAHGFK